MNATSLFLGLALAAAPCIPDTAAPVDQTFTREVALTGPAAKDLLIVHLTAPSFLHPFTWHLQVISHGRILLERTDTDSDIDAFFADEAFVPGCSGYLDCKSAYYFKQFLASATVDFDPLTEPLFSAPTDSNGPSVVPRQFLKHFFPRDPARVNALVRVINQRLHAGSHQFLTVPPSPVVSPERLFWVPEVGMFVPVRGPGE